MKAYVVFSDREPVLIVTQKTIRNEAVLKQLGRVGIRKFIAREVPVAHLRAQYGRQFDVIEDALEKGSDLRVLDFSGRRIFENLPFSGFGPAFCHDSGPAVADSNRKATPTDLRPSPGPLSQAYL